MHLRQFVVDDLAHASYFLGCESTRKAAVIDPERNATPYLEEARAGGFEITHVLETHLHADFVSGHLDLAKKTGARVHLPRKAGALYEHVGLQEGDEVEVGSLLLRVLETPGHTPESACYTVADVGRSKDPQLVLTGDTLFVGSVGRPDLFGADKARELAAQLYDSLHGKLLRLRDEVEVYPAHGAGSFCGAGMGSEMCSTIGRERETNCAFAGKTKTQFVEDLLESLPQTPYYFRVSAHVNRSGPALIGDVLPGGAVSPERAQALIRDGAIPLDVRDAASFGEAHLPGSVHIALGAQFATWAGWVTRPEDTFLLVLPDPSQYPLVAWGLLRIGYDRIAGYLEGGVESWRRTGHPIEVLPQITVGELARRLQSGGEKPQVLDVRTPAEWNAGHIEGADHLPGSEIPQREEFRPRGPLAVICATGFRSSIAASLLARRGFRSLCNVTGGTNAWRKAGLPVTPEGKP